MVRNTTAHLRTSGLVTKELRTGRSYRKIRANFITKAKAVNAPCWLHAYGMCKLGGVPINYQAKTRARNSPELDHRYPASTHPHLVRDPANFRIAHATCNQARGKREPTTPPDLHKHTSSMHKTWEPAAW